MQIHIRRPEEITERESAQLEHVDGEAYAGAQNDLEWTQEPNWQVWLEVDGRAVSCLNIVEREARVGDRPVRLGGIGGVATLPAEQRKGYAAQIMRAAADFMRDTLKVDFGFLCCHKDMLPYYARLGWQQIDSLVIIEQPEGKRRMHYPCMILICAGNPWPEGEVDLCGLPW